jgi:hypothetical protein
VISEILSEQTPDVDAVSGATYSSNGIMEAVRGRAELTYTEPGAFRRLATAKPKRAPLRMDVQQ